MPIFKTLLSAHCVNSCRYCLLRRGSRVPRYRWDPGRLVKTFLRLWREGRVEGLFLSSCVYGDPETVVEDELEVVRALRRAGYRGYVHLRLMPGTPRYLVEEAARVADRVGVNLESPRRDVFEEVAPDKGDYRADLWAVLAECVRASRGARADVDTQVIVGLGESDADHLVLTARLLGMGLSRVHYSPFEPLPGTPLERLRACPGDRARRLYQAFHLMRNYGFGLDELLALARGGMLPRVSDLKAAYAELAGLRVDANDAGVAELVRVPGIGPRTAEALVRIRESRRLRPEDLVRVLGLKRARRALRYLSF